MSNNPEWIQVSGQISILLSFWHLQLQSMNCEESANCKQGNVREILGIPLILGVFFWIYRLLWQEWIHLGEGLERLFNDASI